MIDKITLNKTKINKKSTKIGRFLLQFTCYSIQQFLDFQAWLLPPAIAMSGLLPPRPSIELPLWSHYLHIFCLAGLSDYWPCHRWLRQEHAHQSNLLFPVVRKGTKGNRIWYRNLAGNVPGGRLLRTFLKTSPAAAAAAFSLQFCIFFCNWRSCSWRPSTLWGTSFERFLRLLRLLSEHLRSRCFEGFLYQSLPRYDEFLIRSLLWQSWRDQFQKYCLREYHHRALQQSSPWQHELLPYFTKVIVFL